MKITITGAKGRLGYDLAEAFSACHHVTALIHSEFEITDCKQVDQFFAAEHPDWVIHSAAIADADVCQQNPHLAYSVNTLGTQNLALACARHKTGMLFISTDYVFDGEKGRPYLEFDPVRPLNIYGQSKLAAEQFIQAHLERFYLVRTAWLFGLQGNNFLTSVLDGVVRQEPVLAAYDQTGSPTFTTDLAQALLALVESDYFGTYHIVNPGGMTWIDYARLILTKAGRHGIIEPIRKEQRGPAPRPANTTLENFCLNERRIYAMPPVEEAVERCVQTLTQKGGRFA